ncbi:MAG: transposase [Candidatus Woesearchaeota archaeon]
MSKTLRNKSFSNLRRNEIVEIIEKKGYVSWGELESETGTKKKRLRNLLRNDTLCVSLNSKRQFFTLRELVLKNKKFDSPIWVKDDKVFSSVGDLKDTAHHIVQNSPQGIDENSLTKMLNTPTKNVLRELKENNKIKPVAFEGRQVFFSVTQKRFSKQFQRRASNESCEEVQITYEEFLKTLEPEIRPIAEDLVPEELKNEGKINYKEFIKLLLIQPKLTQNSDRQISRLLRNSSRIKRLIKLKITGHSSISKYKDLLEVEFYVRMFEMLVEKVIKISGLNEVTVLVDCTVNERYKRDTVHARCHTAIIAELKCPVAAIVTKGKVHESPIFERLLSKIEKLKVKIKYVICDAGYDAARIFVRVAKRLKSIAIIPTRDQKKGLFDISTFQLSLDYYFEGTFKNEVQELVNQYPEAKAGAIIREMVTAIKKLDWWKEIYKMRTGVERFFSWTKAFLGLTKTNGLELRQVARHIYQTLAFTVAQTLVALKLGITNETARYKSFIV